jgi:hypothetical protein
MKMRGGLWRNARESRRFGHKPRSDAGLGLQELRQLREENRKLKGIVGNLMLGKHILQEMLSRRA